MVQLDGEGNKEQANIGALTIINMKDVHSKAYVLSYPLSLKSKFSHAKTEDYQNCVRLAFMDFGRFKKLQVDHESVFYDNTHKTPYPTIFHLWLCGLGVELCFTPKGNPQKQGMVERSHQTMDRQVFQGRTYKKWEEVLLKCWERRNRLNYEIPSRVLNNQPPLKANPKAVNSGLKYTPKKEEKLFCGQRIYEYLSTCEGWCRKITKGAFYLGSIRYGTKKIKEEKEIKIRFNPLTQLFDLYDSNKILLESIKPKGLDFKHLSGNLDQFIEWEKEHRKFMPKK